VTYQLVLQWPTSSSIDSYDSVIELEDLLIETLADDVVIDGHDLGAGQMNSFIWTSDPRSTFAAAQSELAANEFWAQVRAGFREESEEANTVTWPPNLQISP
jgi:hypothetical protein